MDPIVRLNLKRLENIFQISAMILLIYTYNSLCDRKLIQKKIPSMNGRSHKRWGSDLDETYLTNIKRLRTYQPLLTNTGKSLRS